ncbi:lipase [Vibrio sp. 10N.286.49.B3]|uniref:VolA/Pla-1 family phospholipase n=1 Tax=Vibrio sp. 10N.286.49.B3 TaxID=1880855 RepID=UPI000C843C14|nr:VolA/Pla-1 family phospholipase [Vibrio sp. 10N.286.49.B3]PMH41411.1 lipase [Vibrio sp. 10N.286.49.B3]
MEKTFKLSLVFSAILLAGCGDDTESSGAPTTPVYEDFIQESLEQPTTIQFTLSGQNAAVPLPSFALLDTSDGTLGLPTGGDDALSNPIAAMNTADGFSTTMPISLTFEGGDFGETQNILTSGIYVVELSDGLTGSPTPQAILSAPTDFVTLAQGSNLTIIFNEPLNPKSNYIFAVTNEVLDSDGEAVGMSSSYAAAKSEEKIYTEGSLAQVQQVTQGVEALFAATGVDKETIIYSSWFITQSVGDSLYATKGATATGLASGGLNNVWALDSQANPNNVDLTYAYIMSFEETATFNDALDNDSDFDDYIGSDAKAGIKALYEASDAEVNVTQGTVNLPHYLEQDLATWNSQPFQSAMPSLAKISAALSDENEQAHVAGQLMAAGITPSLLATSPEEQLKLVGQSLTLSDGSALDSERVITQYSPVPQVKSLEAVEFILFTPTNSTATEIAIYQHGITSAKENAYAFAFNQAQQGIAVLAIDLPLHGTRSLDEDRSANVDTLAYLNLTYLPVARDNLRQSALDVMGLRAALAVSSQAGLLTTTPLSAINPVTSSHFIGHSLGGIVGVSAVAAANESLGSDTADALYNFSSMSIQNSGGQIANLLLGSTNFGPLIMHNIALSLSIGYDSYVAENCTDVIEQICFAQFSAQATEEQQAVMSAGFQQFSYAAQTVLDTIDPFTNASHLVDNATLIPVLMSQVADDDTVPNSVDFAPFAGTEPLAAQLSLDETSTPGTTGGFVKFTDSAAGHSTFVAPKSDLSDIVTHATMQSQQTQFIAPTTTP